MSEEDVKAFSAWEAEDLEEENQTGNGQGRRLNTVESETVFSTEKSPEGGALRSGASGSNYWQRLGANRREGTNHRRGGVGCAEGNSRWKPWTWQWGEINPQGR